MTSSQLSDQLMYSRGQVLTRDFNTLRSLIVLPVVHRRPVTARDPRERTHVRRTAELARTVLLHGAL
jgi:hypothetical protein